MGADADVSVHQSVHVGTIVCEYVASEGDLTGLLPHNIHLANVFDPAKCTDAKFVGQLEWDIYQECTKHGPVLDVITVASGGLIVK